MEIYINIPDLIIKYGLIMTGVTVLLLLLNGVIYCITVNNTKSISPFIKDLYKFIYILSKLIILELGLTFGISLLYQVGFAIIYLIKDILL